MSPTQQYFSNAVGSVLLVPGAFVYLHFSGESLGSAELRALYSHTRNLLQQHGLRRILADHRAMPDAFTPAEQQRLAQWLRLRAGARPVRLLVEEQAKAGQ